MNIGRNDKCLCGSGKKWKKCCMDKKIVSDIPPEFEELIKNPPPPEPFERGGFLVGRRFIDTTFQGKRVRAVGGSVYLRPIDETFQMFLLNRLAETLGSVWRDSERAKPVDEQHPLFRWFEEFEEEVKNNSRKDTDKIKSVELTGNIRALLAIAYD